MEFLPSTINLWYEITTEIFELRGRASMSSNVCQSVGLFVEKIEILNFNWLCVENTQVSRGEHQQTDVQDYTDNGRCL